VIRFRASYRDGDGPAHPQAGEQLVEFLADLSSPERWHVIVVPGSRGATEIAGSVVLETESSRFASRVIETE